MRGSSLCLESLKKKVVRIYLEMATNIKSYILREFPRSDEKYKFTGVGSTTYPTPRHIIVKLKDIHNKENIWQEPREREEKSPIKERRMDF